MEQDMEGKQITPYTVERIKDGRGYYYVVTYRGEVLRHFGDSTAQRDQADSLAYMLNEAFEQGAAAARA
jgi:hypothetical protein